MSYVRTLPSLMTSATASSMRFAAMKFEHPIPNFGNLADVDSCLHVIGRRLDTINPDGCDFNTVVVVDVSNGANTPILIARNDEGVQLPALDPSSGAMLAGFQPGLTLRPGRNNRKDRCRYP